MARSFSLVEAKVAEVDLFLTKLGEAGRDVFAARCYFSSFVASTRSITYVLQAAMAEVPGFHEWYSKEQNDLTSDPVCRFFHHARRLDHHLGLNPLYRGSVRKGEYNTIRVVYGFSQAGSEDGLPFAPEVDALSACHKYFNRILKVVLDCCIEFKIAIDAKVWFTSENFEEMGLTIEDAEEELYGVTGWTAEPGRSEEQRWQIIRNSVWGSGLESLFQRYASERDGPLDQGAG